MRYVVLLGAPGSGKGTQSGALSAALGLPAISSGDLFRDHISKQTELGVLAQGYMNRGELVPDSVTIRMMMERLAQADAASGAILDGFPRTIAQAEALDVALQERGEKIGSVVYLSVSHDALIRRLSGRWICRSCGASFHEVFNPPARAGACDKCGGALYQRDDDKREAAERRLDVFQEQTAPLIVYYTQQGKLTEVSGEGDIQQIGQDLIRAARVG